MDNRRLILLLVFSFSILMLWDAWQKHTMPKPQVATVTNSGSAAVPAPTLSDATPAVVPGATMAASASTDVPRTVIRTDLLTAEISAQGGDLSRLELNKHLATGDTSKNFVLFESDGTHVYLGQGGLIGEGLPNHKTLWRLIPGSVELKEGQDSVQVSLEAPAGEGSVVKTYTFHRGSYLIDVAYEIRGNARADHAYFQTLRDGKLIEGAGGAMGVSTFTGPAVYTEEGKFQKVAFEDIAKGKHKHVTKAKDGWIAMVQHYFVSAWLPQESSEREFYTRKLGDDLYAAGVILPVADGKVQARLYAGPQEQAKLKQIAPGLELVVDYGWLTVIASPIFWMLELLHKVIGNWGWSIIALTVLIKLAFFPLSAASYKSMAKMKVVTPKLMRLKELYADDRARLNQEMMDLYKKEKINPLGGCLPILIQIPVFIALYWVLLGVVEMRNAPWLGWIVDLSTKDPYYVLPLIMGATMLIQTRLNPTPPDPMQAKVMMIMPVVFTGMFLFFPSGLVLYWIVNNVLSIAQQWQITRMIEGGEKKAA
ncbi:membrane protein insertase YidC [Denitratisoma oestradiolicum]|uniref:Membrane protein insertase YidC n=1 Tax=Denitratisoma oestradiolicum TaxID=311182 RepID=A0A6S6Y5Z0_9PROT|nr:membrane protein insertase YidC [Denitratisoma oestradiolicum]TWO80722.1 membrane protein insertase YidC [Denitratisoma oestradiolicum]CAB1370977.1 Membrane protein insertase YidC [Denitratisoma oestradiolicum]